MQVFSSIFNLFDKSEAPQKQNWSASKVHLRGGAVKKRLRSF